MRNLYPFFDARSGRYRNPANSMAARVLRKGVRWRECTATKSLFQRRGQGYGWRTWRMAVRAGGIYAFA